MADIPNTMRALRIHEQGGPEVIQLDEIPVPHPKGDQVLIKVEHAGVNFIGECDLQSCFVVSAEERLANLQACGQNCGEGGQLV